MGNYSNSAAFDYDFEVFEEHVRASAGAAAPKKESEPKPELKLIENKKAQAKKAERGFVALRSTFIVAVAVMVLFAICTQIHAGAKNYELSQQIEAMEKKIAEAETENVRLQNKFNSITTIENIDYYAHNVLGMTKTETYQIKCIDLSDGDKILYSGNKNSIFDFFTKN